MSRRLRREDYTVGWICATEIEWAAARHMLDKEHPVLERDSDDNDQNLYALGSIGGHNIAIGCLPAGEPGNNSAAAVATQMKATFKGIRFGLMVGIGGGVPSQSFDIRLGDVVVSTPDSSFGGVVQYDMGTNTPDGFMRKGSMNSPPRILLAAVAHVNADAIMRRSKLSSYIAGLEALNDDFHRNRTGPDILFEAAYDHEGGSKKCDGCRDNRQVVREERKKGEEVKVHGGTIASGNQVMKSGTERDKISHQLGGVLCFEMEAAGLMNNFPCLVIRGISDYADSHKNDSWQPYAAGTAASYAKELLSVLPQSDVAKIDTVEEIIRRTSRIETVPISHAHQEATRSLSPPSLPPRNHLSTDLVSISRRPIPSTYNGTIFEMARPPNQFHSQGRIHTRSTPRELEPPPPPAGYPYQEDFHIRSMPSMFEPAPQSPDQLVQAAASLTLAAGGRRSDYTTPPTNMTHYVEQSRSNPELPYSSITQPALNQSSWSSVNLQGNLPTLKAKKFRDPKTLLYTIQSDSRFMKSLEKSHPSFHSFIRKSSARDIVDILEVLLRSGLNPNDPQYVGDYGIEEQGANPHMWILHDNWRTLGEDLRFEVFKLFVAHDADVIHYQMKNGRTALHRACSLGLLDVVLFLLDHGANVNAETQLGFPVRVATGKNQPRIIECLVQRGARLNVASAPHVQPLLTAVRQGYEEAAKILLRNGADVNARDRINNTPIMVAAAFGRLTIAKYILEEYGKYVDRNAKSIKGRTALAWAIIPESPGSPVNTMTCTRMVELLLQYRFSPNAMDNQSNYVLHYAAKYGLAQVARILVASGANTEVLDLKNNTPLLWAVGKGHIDVVRVLVEEGAKLRPYPGRCDTAMAVARRWQQKEVVLFLEKYFPKPAVNRNNGSNRAPRRIVEGRRGGFRAQGS